MNKVLLATVLALTGCAVAPLAPIPAGTNLIVTRPSQFSSGGVDYGVQVDNDKPVVVASGSTAFLTVQPGSHILRVASHLSGNSGAYVVTIAAGQIVHLNLAVHNGVLAQPHLDFSLAQ